MTGFMASVMIARMFSKNAVTLSRLPDEPQGTSCAVNAAVNDPFTQVGDTTPSHERGHHVPRSSLPPHLPRPPAATAVVVLALLALPVSRRTALAADSLPVCGSSDVEFIGFSDALNKTSYRGIPAVELSGLSYDAQRGVYYVIADRSATGPTHVFTLSAPVSDNKLATPSIIGSAILSQTPDQPYTGQNFDGEGIAFAGGVSMFVSSEGGGGPGQQPAIEQFSIYGGHLASLKVPANLQIGGNNLSFEGLALSPSGRSLFVSMEAPIAADGLTLGQSRPHPHPALPPG